MKHNFVYCHKATIIIIKREFKELISFFILNIISYLIILSMLTVFVILTKDLFVIQSFIYYYNFNNFTSLLLFN
jgi:hypothetical protein